VRNDFDWEDIRPPLIPPSDEIVYELHVRGFTCHPSSGVAHPGTYLGLIEKIPYLQELGVNVVELLPVYEFDELENRRIDPLTGERLKNFWGYSPICFFAPKAAYAVDGRDGNQVHEFKTMVRELHRSSTIRARGPAGPPIRRTRFAASTTRCTTSWIRKPAPTSTTRAAATRSTATTRWCAG
jgi:pullulanase/glycogen debranching enzyme